MWQLSIICILNGILGQTVRDMRGKWWNPNKVWCSVSNNVSIWVHKFWPRYYAKAKCSMLKQDVTSRENWVKGVQKLSVLSWHLFCKLFFKKKKKKFIYQQAHEKMLSIANGQGNASQNHNEVSPHFCQNGHHQKDQLQMLVRMWRKGHPRTLLVRT